MPHPQNQVWMADGNVYRMGVYADNSGVSPGQRTVGIEWRRNNHPVFSSLYAGYEIPQVEEDFFDRVVTEDVLNRLGHSSYMFAFQFDGPLVGQGQGFLVYNFTAPANTQLAVYRFILSPSRVYTYMLNEQAIEQQPVSIGADFITVIPNLNAMSSATQGPGVLSSCSYDFDSDGDVDLRDWARAQRQSSVIRN
jgi:hypothetical protein